MNLEWLDKKNQKISIFNMYRAKQNITSFKIILALPEE
jgi:hypothetical protein